MLRLRDPVCGMEIGWEEAVDHERVGPVVVYFCCRGCASWFRDQTRHVDPRAWLAEEAANLKPGMCCGRAPTDGRHGFVSKALHHQAVPRIGSRTVDDLESSVLHQWRGLLRLDQVSALHTRVLERALLLRCLARASDDLVEIDRRLAAEVARLRDSCELNPGHIEVELEALLCAFARALAGLDLGPAEGERVRHAFETGLQEARTWLRRRPGPA